MTPLCFIILGEDTEILVSPSATLQSALEQALTASGLDRGVPMSTWEVHAESGALLDARETVLSLGLKRAQRLFVSLPIGAQG